MNQGSAQDKTRPSADEAARLDGAVEQFLDLLARLVAEPHWQEQHQEMEADDNRNQDLPIAAIDNDQLKRIIPLYDDAEVRQSN